MISLSFLVGAGPCLILAMGAIALGVVNAGLRRARHTVLWAVSGALGAVQWSIIAGQGGVPADWIAGLLMRLAGVASLLLLIQGLLLRRGRRARDPTTLCAGALALTGAGMAGLIAIVAFRAAVLPGISVLLLLGAMRLVVRGDRPSPTEAVVVSVLFALVLVNLLIAGLAIGEGLALLPPRQAYVALALVTVEPASAALVLALIMLIASDYSAELRRLLHTDPLTGVLNREGFDHAARLLIDRGRLRRLAVAVADVDRFKQINDVHGHAVGDATLTGVAAALAERLGREGTVARIGGEEFAILLPGLDGGAALRRVERLREDLAGTAVQPALSVTASFGVAEREPGEALDQAIERADAALYRAKRAGRNRVTLADPAAA